VHIIVMGVTAVTGKPGFPKEGASRSVYSMINSSHNFNFRWSAGSDTWITRYTQRVGGAIRSGRAGGGIRTISTCGRRWCIRWRRGTLVLAWIPRCGCGWLSGKTSVFPLSFVDLAITNHEG